MDRTIVIGSMGAAIALAIAGCSSDAPGPTSGSGGSSSSSSGSTSSTSSSSGGGAGCVAASTYASAFTIEDASLCAVAVFEAEESFSFTQPSWGSHGGPLTIRPATSGKGAVELVRWKAPDGTTGKLTSTTTDVDAKLPDLLGSTSPKTSPAAFLSEPAIDLPFFAGLTAIAYTGAEANGEIVLAKDKAVSARYPANGTYAMAAIGADAAHGRLLYTGETAPGALTGDGGVAAKNALYAADACGASQPSIANTSDASCMPIAVASWGSASGPVAADSDGNVFVAMSAGTQSAPMNDARAFAAASIAHGGAASEGTPLFMIAGFAGSMAAIAPASGADGFVAFQASDPTFTAQDVVAQHYTTSGGAITVKGTPATLLKLATAGSEVILFTDDKGRLWAGVPDDATSKTTFVVIARTSM